MTPVWGKVETDSIDPHMMKKYTDLLLAFASNGKSLGFYLKVLVCYIFRLEK